MDSLTGKDTTPRRRAEDRRRQDRPADAARGDASSPQSESPAPSLDPERDLVAYFCMEFGLYEGLKLYSGGMGILAGDHIKAASDLGIPLAAVGLLYHQGYFDQRIDREGQQQHEYVQANFAELPLTPAIDVDGEPFQVHVELPGRSVALNVWKVNARKIDLYLLDSDVAENGTADREITYQLYGGGRKRRIEQEIVLGIGGVRALRALGYEPTVWHSNEGHSAFQILERCRGHIEQGLDFATALELVASNTVFTTHTPVPAGHDLFEPNLMQEYFSGMVEDLGLSVEEFMSLGGNGHDHGSFNMTALALRGSRFHNAVSRTHRDVAAHLDSYIWRQAPPVENPMIHVTNGVHAATFLSPVWSEVFTKHLGRDWRHRLSEPGFWDRVKELPDTLVWNVRRLLKEEMLGVVRGRHLERLQRVGRESRDIERLTRWIDPANPDVLTVGFARRFATYKRAMLVLSDPERLRRIVDDEKRPLVLIFAGKAHPRDLEGQRTIRQIHDMAHWPEFEGKIILVEGYDLPLAKALVRGVDVWLNTPQFPLEASGTSGMKAGMNGVLNLSVLDGWWAEGFDSRNGWGIFPRTEIADPGERDRAEAAQLFDLLGEQVIPAYYQRDPEGIPHVWMTMVKESMRSIIPRFNAARMLADYRKNLYGPAAVHGNRLREGAGERARTLSEWKRKVASSWPRVALRRLDHQPGVADGSPTPPVRIAASLGELTVDDVVVECVWGREFGEPGFKIRERRAYRPAQGGNPDEAGYELDLEPGFAAGELADLDHGVRIYPRHPLLAHPMETGLMTWLS